MGNNCFSYHIFMFPFRFDHKDGDMEWHQMDLRKRTDPSLITNCLPGGWQREAFDTGTPGQYNEHAYFHDFARDALFDREKQESGILRSYRFQQQGDNSFYRIHIKGKQEPYDLKIDKILLNMYSSGVGVLSFHLENNAEDGFDDILRINDFGRRMFPIFLDSKSEPMTGKPKDVFMADKLELVIDGQSYLEDDFTYYDRIDNIKTNPLLLSKIVTGLLGECFVTDDQNMKPGDILITPILDDRMFVMCWANQPKICEQLKEYDEDEGAYNYLDCKKNDQWYKYVFVDGKDITCHSIPLRKALLTKHTYDRWIEKDTLYGITRNSFVVLSDSSLVLLNLRTVYYRMINLVLVQRASLLRFSDEIARIAAMEEPELLCDRVRRLQEAYLTFVNKIYIREVTSQEQGIELYDHIQQSMNTERDVKDLNAEIDQLHQYSAMERDRRSGRLLNFLSILAALFVIPAFVTGFFGMNVFTEKMELTPGYIAIIGSIFLVALLGTLLVIRRNKYKEKKLSGIEKFLLIMLVLVVVLLLLLPTWVCLVPGAGS
jgi:hypothetical protein